MTSVAVNQKLLAAAVDSLAEDNLTAMRKSALARFGEDGFPSVRHEDWRYTNLAPAAEISNQWLQGEQITAEPDSADNDAITSFTKGIDAHWIVISNGVLNAESMAAKSHLENEGVTIAPLTESVNDIQVYIDDPLASFNASLLADGLLVRVADEAKMEKPIGLLMLDTAKSSAQVSQTRVLIEVGENAKGAIVEKHVSVGESAHLANSVVQVSLAHGATADYVRIQERNEEHILIGKVLAELQQDATLNYATIDVGGKLVRNDIVSNILGPGATTNISGVYLADGRQHIDNHILTDHFVGPAKSIQNFRGIVSGHARCVFNGKAVVHEGADGTDAEQSNHNLLLSETAEVDTKPELEIFADDVKCSHGATVGQLDKSALFYLRSRGLDMDQAAALLTRAFAGQILKQLPLECVQSYVDKLIEIKLDALTEDTAT